MRPTDLKHFCKFYLTNIRRAKKLIQCNMINDIKDSFEYITQDRYPIRVDIVYEFDPDAFSIQFDFDLTGLPPEFIYSTLCFDTKDTLIFLSNENLKIEFQLDYSEWLQEEEFFQISLIHNFGDTNLQYWKDCMHMLEIIEKEMTNV